ncbi:MULTISPECIES: hypothetical protein [unclassified Marinifilum]|uniref:hypothetical protein n=1 Tax=unclassified Marinifilum TaxID=2642519 RepID=UPI0022735BC3|nr:MULTISPECIES: hypothetical protein [unclassified Marinifilum]MCY1634987.1 hypothetical protein [Marinifilum sp. D737]MDQ2178587.1 hypothetical protein [Marinifilum sp. D714]
MHKLSFTLKQHTPIIHFQPTQDGATLRATELKPKLDKFLIEKFKQEGTDYEEWLIPGQQGALDYKVKIIPLINKKTHKVIAYTPKDKEDAISSYNNINDNRIIIQTFFFPLKEMIEKKIRQFFVLHNFGKRQSKGYGCYSVEDSNITDILKNCKLDVYVKNYNNNGDEYNLKSDTQLDDYFYKNVISRDWSLIKSGKNFHGYEKSQLFYHFNDKGLKWDKPFIKRKLMEHLSKRNEKIFLMSKYENRKYQNKVLYDTNDEIFRFGRAMLGLAEHYEFKATNNRLFHVEVKHENIERFKSPVTFKVYDGKIYLIVNKLPQELINDTEGFSFNVKEYQGNGSNKQLLSEFKLSGILKLPSFHEFNLDEFMNKALVNNKLNYKKLV